MKKLALAFVLSLSALVPTATNAQISVNFNVNAQPLWGPVGYDQANYYYMPDIETYYNVPKRQYVYQNNGQWVFANSLPSRYSNYNLYNGYKVVLNTPKPYLNFNTDRVKYAKYKGVKGQSVIKYSKDPKYKTIHANSNGVPPGQAKKVVVGSNQRVVVAGSNGEKGKIKHDDNENHNNMNMGHENKGEKGGKGGKGKKD